MKDFLLKKNYIFWFLLFPLLQIFLFTTGTSLYDQNIPIMINIGKLSKEARSKVETWELNHVFKPVYITSLGEDNFGVEPIAVLAEEKVGLVNKLKFRFLKSNLISYLQFRLYIAKLESKEPQSNIEVQYGSKTSNWVQLYIICGIVILLISVLSKFLFFLINEKTASLFKSFSVSFLTSITIFHLYWLFANLFVRFSDLESYLNFMICLSMLIMTNLLMTKIVLTLISDRNERIGKLVLLILPEVLLSGLILPVERMSFVVRSISKIVPSTHIIEAFRNTCIRGMPIGHRTMAMSLGVLFFYLLLLTVILKRKERLIERIEN